jgi:hypothetical protein
VTAVCAQPPESAQKYLLNQVWNMLWISGYPITPPRDSQLISAKQFVEQIIDDLLIHGAVQQKG